MFILLRRVERWLHQHVFKVGWLVTQNYQTTTILYYTVFLPGVLLHEVVYWLAAGIFNVRAEGDIKWPDEQEVGELQLNFVKLAPRTGTYRRAFITSAPLLVGLVCIWLIANNIFDITTVVQTMSTGEISDVVAAWQLLTGAPLFWLWVYIIFTIANTMFPTVPKDLRGWRSIMLGLGVVAIALLVLGVGGEIFEAVQTPLSRLISVLQSTFILIMLIDVLVVMVLGLIEYTIERSTGRSATFRRGKMITMTREEVLAEREKERERKRKAREREARKQAAQSVTQSIYALPFATPGSPKDAGITALESLEEDVPDEVEETVEDGSAEPSMPVFGGLANDGKPPERPLSEEEKAQRAAIAERVNLPKVPTVPKPSEFESDSDGVDEPAEKPTPVMPSRFNRATPPAVAPAVDDDTADDDKDVIDTPAASAPSRFGRPLSRISDDVNESAGEDDNAIDKPAVTTSRFGKPVSPVEDEANTDENSKDKAVEKPAVTTSRFGRPLSPMTDEEETDTDKDEDDKVVDKPAVTTSRFGRPVSPTPTPSPAEDEDDKQVSEKSTVTTSRFGRSLSPTPDNDDADNDDADEDDASDDTGAEKPAARGQSVFGKPLSDVSRPAPLVTDDAPPTLDEPEEVIAVVGRPSSPSLFDEDIEDDESVDNARRREGDDAVGSLFAQLQGSGSEDEDDESAGQAVASTRSRFSFLGDEGDDFDDEDDDESVGTRFGSRSSAFGSRFGASSNDSDEEDEDDDESVGTRFGSGTSRFGRTFGTGSFGTSRPAPKPSASNTDDEDEDETDAVDEDEIVYEDLDDVEVYDYEDEGDYIDYDDDESYYYDDDD